MKLDNKELYDFLVEKGITFLNHANTGATSVTFIRAGGLLSRGTVEHLNLYQSPQSSDALDKVFNVWHDIFLDTTDLHGYFPRQNFYGPVLFKFSIDFLLKENFDVWITKDNPINWKVQMPDEDRYFKNVQELAEKWDIFQRQKKMVTIRNQKSPILFNYLDQIILDDPRVKIVENNVVLFNQMVKGIKEAIGENISLKNKLTVRECNTDTCYCRSNYLHQIEVKDLQRLFLP